MQPTQPRTGPVGAARSDLHRRTRLRAARRNRVRADVPGDCRSGGKSGGDRDYKPAFLRMVAGHPKPAAVQGADRSTNGPGAHHHHRCQLLSVPPHRHSARPTKHDGERKNDADPLRPVRPGVAHIKPRRVARIHQHYWAKIHGHSHAATALESILVSTRNASRPTCSGTHAR